MKEEDEKQTKLSEHIVKSIVQPISKEPVAGHSFTTEPKRHQRRGRNLTRDRCLEFMDILREKGYTKTIPLEQAKDLFQVEMGIMDRISLKSYFGSQPQTVHRKIRRIARYATGTMSFKTIELSQDIPKKKGHFELLGLVTFEKKGETWFMILTGEPLIAELGFPHGEGSVQSNPNLSLTPIPLRLCEAREVKEGSNDIETVERQQTHTHHRVRDNLSLEKEYSDSSTKDGKLV